MDIGPTNRRTDIPGERRVPSPASRMRRGLRQLVAIVCLLAIGVPVAHATKPSPIRVPVGVIEPWPQNREEMIGWFRVHGEEIAGRLRDGERLKHRGRGTVQGQLLFEQSRIAALEPPRIDAADPWPQPEGSHVVERMRMVYEVAVPNVREGQAWMVKTGRVILGYRRPLPDVHASQTDEQVLEGKRLTRSSAYDSMGRSEQIAPNEQPRFGDRPIMASDVVLSIGENGRVYF